MNESKSVPYRFPCRPMTTAGSKGKKFVKTDSKYRTQFNKGENSMFKTMSHF